MQVFRILRRAIATLRDRLMATDGRADRIDLGAAIRESGFDAAPIAQIVVDADSRVALANRKARAAFSIAADDLHRPFTELGLSYCPIDLRASVDQALTERREVRLGPVRWTLPSGETRQLEVELTPLLSGTTLHGMAITFADVSSQQRLREDLERSRRELETTNEELQSTNEELETTNEELQSTNEELETMSDELRQRTLELDEVNAFLELILTSLGVAVVVLDRQLQIQVWNGHSEDLWGLRSDEVVGTHFLGLEIGLAVEQLKAPIRRALQDERARSATRLPATTRRGKRIECVVTCLPLAVADGDVSGVILLMERQDERPLDQGISIGTS